MQTRDMPVPPTPGMGPIGRVTRLTAAGGLLYLALFTGSSLTLTWYDSLLGLVALPGAMLALGLVGRAHSSAPVRFTGPVGTMLNCAVIVGLLNSSYTAHGAELFYGATLLVAAGCGQLGCEATVVSNVLLHRNDQVGCPVFSPIDRIEAQRATRRQPEQLRRFS